MYSTAVATSSPVGSVAFAGNKVVVKFPFNPQMVQLIKNAPDGYEFNKPRRAWLLPVTADNLRFLTAIGFGDFSGEIGRLESPLRLLESTQMPEFKTKPYAHQERGLRLGLANEELFLGWEMGTGKTFTAIMTYLGRMNAGQVKRLLVICPKCVVISWVNEFQKHAGIEATTLVKTDDPELPTLPKPKRLARIKTAEILVMQYEGVIFTPELLLENWDMLILDESHYIKSYTAKRSKLIHKLAAGIRFKMLMTGTPVTSGPEDVFSQFYALDGGKTFGSSYYAFRARYFVNKGWGDIPDWQIRPGAIAELHQKITLKMDRVKKSECMDLPPKNYQVVYVDMTVEQARAYRQMEKEFMVEFQDRLGPDGKPSSVEVNYLITKMMKLNQITSGFIYDHDQEGREIVYRLESNRMKVLREQIEDKKKVIVWCLFRQDIHDVLAAFPEMNPVTTKEWKRFQADPSIRLIVGQVHAGGIGITLTEADFTVYYSQGYSLADRLQNEDRNHRIGTKSTVTYIDLVCPGTIDEDILTAIAEKREMAGALLGDESVAADVLHRMREKALGRATK